MAVSLVHADHNVPLLRSAAGANLSCRQSDAARVLVVHNLRSRHNTVPHLWEIHTVREAVQGRLAGICVHDPAFLSHGIRACHFALRDEQCHYDRPHRQRDLAAVDWQQISSGFTHLLCSDVSLGPTSLRALTDV